MSWWATTELPYPKHTPSERSEGYGSITESYRISDRAVPPLRADRARSGRDARRHTRSRVNGNRVETLSHEIHPLFLPPRSHTSHTVHANQFRCQPTEQQRLSVVRAPRHKTSCDCMTSLSLSPAPCDGVITLNAELSTPKPQVLGVQTSQGAKNGFPPNAEVPLSISCGRRPCHRDRAHPRGLF